jgi:hypothetical protein
MPSGRKNPMFESLLKRLKELDGSEILIRAEGEYPTKARTKVQAVAKYQNDGTDRGIKPAHFVEYAASQHSYWQEPIFQAIGKYMSGHGLGYDLRQVGLRIAYDINVAVNRIKTGRLKKSFRPLLRQRGSAGWRIEP